MKKATLVITVIAAAASVAYLTLNDKPINKQAVKAIKLATHSAVIVQNNKITEVAIKHKKTMPLAVRVDSSPIQASSQQDTEIDQTSLRDMFDYFLSGFDETEMDIEQLKANVKRFITNNPERYSTADYDLFERFLLYKQSLLSIDVNQDPNIDDLERLDSELRDKQLALFSTAEQKLLFNNENLHRQVTIKKLYLKSIAVSQEDYRYQLKEELSNFPEEISRVYQDDLVTSELNQIANYDDEQQRYIAYEAIGPEVAVRMTELEHQETALDNKIKSYLTQRRQIMNDDSHLNKEARIDDLRYALFNTAEQKRIRSLEYIDDL
ncbi:Lipase chaperone [Moritella sp. JT01]|uniref:lipase secretion chaperone n=1 Tax=Moritella sp. JT01 TaxID=756698 RepID=UPI000792EFD3|nr:lipase secretion chaperone [Moritella sp. JT01]KXO07501.1 Lipase chaperone [Moritella sp. JT01]